MDLQRSHLLPVEHPHLFLRVKLLQRQELLQRLRLILMKRLHPIQVVKRSLPLEVRWLILGGIPMRSHLKTLTCIQLRGGVHTQE